MTLQLFTHQTQVVCLDAHRKPLTFPLIVLYSNIPFPADRFIDFECEENVVHAESERRGKHYQKEENWNEF